MPKHSPILALHERAEAITETYGPPEAGVTVVQTYGQFEVEYACLRKGAVLLDLPNRAALVVTGPDRQSFLNSMLTNELKGVAAGQSQCAFWLSRKGRIDADVRVQILSDRIVLDVDTHAHDRTLKTLASYIIMEQCELASLEAATHRLALHGPSSAAILASLVDAADREAVAAIARDTVIEATIAGHRVIIDRCDSTGEIGLELTVPTDAAVVIYTAILDRGTHPPQAEGDAPAQLHGGHQRPAFRPAGWAAYNIARIEAGTPLYYIDFGPDSLPAESSLMASRVSFTKGCYLGQEIVARMHSLGAPKQRLVALLMSDTQSPPRQPVTGNFVFAAEATSNTAEPCGAMTSSALSPMLGNAPIGLAMIKSKSLPPMAGGDQPARAFKVEADGELLTGELQPQMAFWPRRP